MVMTDHHLCLSENLKRQLSALGALTVTVKRRKCSDVGDR